MRAPLAAAAAAVILAAAAYLLLSESTSTTPMEVRGVLVDVQSSSLRQAERVTLRTDDARTLVFQVDPDVATNAEHPQSPAHLRQHMTFGDPMVVRYVETADGLLAMRILEGG